MPSLGWGSGCLGLLAQVLVFPGKVGLCLHRGNSGVAQEAAEARGRQRLGSRRADLVLSALALAKRDGEGQAPETNQ